MRTGILMRIVFDNGNSLDFPMLDVYSVDVALDNFVDKLNEKNFMKITDGDYIINAPHIIYIDHRVFEYDSDGNMYEDGKCVDQYEELKY